MMGLASFLQTPALNTFARTLVRKGSLLDRTPGYRKQNDEIYVFAQPDAGFRHATGITACTCYSHKYLKQHYLFEQAEAQF